MNAGRKEGTVRIKLTISREEHPAMSEALANEPQSRAKTAQVTERIRMIKAAPRNDWISGYIAE